MQASVFEWQKTTGVFKIIKHSIKIIINLQLLEITVFCENEISNYINHPTGHVVLCFTPQIFSRPSDEDGGRRKENDINGNIFTNVSALLKDNVGKACLGLIFTYSNLQSN